jgi:hypothetical protein
MAILNKGTTYASGDNVTAANLNTLVDSATFKTGSNEATDNSTLQVHSDGYLMVKDGGISSSKLATGAVDSAIGSGAITSTQLATNSVTSSQIASNAVTSAEIASSAVTSAKIADNAITSAKISDTDTQFLVDDTSTQKKVVINEAGADVDFRVEGDTNANLIVTDAATDKVSIRGAVGSVAPTTIYGGCEFKSANIQISRSNASAGIRLQEDTTLSSPNQQSDILLREADGALVFTKPQKQTDSVTHIFEANGGIQLLGSVLPVNNNSANIGSASKRWQTIYAVNGTINTSDGNQKEQIEELSDAELRVAQACKGLVRKFKIKGGTRKHIGVIAQDVRDAFTAQSLDAHEYGLFCSDTWTDEDTGEEVTQLGIRYDELLAFIISAL